MPPRAPVPLRPAADTTAFSALAQGAQDTLVDTFLRWTFGHPTNASPTRPLQQGEWLPVQPRNNAGEHPLAEGGSGIVHLWCCVDTSGHIIDRVIVKETVPGLVHWNRPRMWANGVVGGEPREHATCDDLFRQLEATNAGDGKFMTECFGYGDMRGPYGNNPQGQPILNHGQVRVDVARYKLYFEYCPYGDLYDLIDRHKRANKLFEEGFIWMIFEALAKCVDAMELSNMVHGDMSTSNILLGTHDPQRFKIWPVPKLADFGASRYLNAFEMGRGDGLIEPMQPDFSSPELSRGNHGGWEIANLTLSAKTNVWNIGLLICCMMRLEPVLPETEWRFTAQHLLSVPQAQQLQFAIPAQRELPAASFQRNGANYSQALLDLARDCMRYDPVHRPTPTNLLQSVQTHMATRVGNFDTYTGGPTGRIPWNKAGRIIGKITDEWSIMTKADFVWS